MMRPKNGGKPILLLRSGRGCRGTPLAQRRAGVCFMFFLILVLFVLLALGGGGWGYSRWGAAGGIGPIGLIVIVFACLYLTGNLHV
jgi:hypothetical protein